MKRKFWIGIGVTLPLALFGPMLAAREAASWRPRLVATNPDGNCFVSWSHDGRLVRLNPVDLHQNLQWGNAYFDTQWHNRVEDGEKRFVLPHYELRANYPSEASGLKVEALSVCSNPSGACRPLRGTTWKLHGIEQFDASTSGWNFQASQFSPDEREISILSAGEVRVWSTRTGQFLRRVVLSTPKESVLTATFSPGNKWIVTELANPKGIGNKLTIFDVIEGTKRWEILLDGNQDFGFASSGNMVWVGTSSASFVNDNKGKRLSFYDARSGRKLWTCLQYCATPLFSPLQNEVFIADANGLQKRRCRDGKVVKTFPGPAKGIYRMALSPDASQIWSSHNNGQIWSWRVR